MRTIRPANDQELPRQIAFFTPKNYMAPMRSDEDTIQASIVEWVRWVAPGILIWSVPNGGYRLKSEAAKLKWTGLLSGVPDLTLVWAEGCAFWEVKTPKGALSPDQDYITKRLGQMGHTWAIVRSIEDARRELTRLGIATREAA